MNLKRSVIFLSLCCGVFVTGFIVWVIWKVNTPEVKFLKYKSIFVRLSIIHSAQETHKTEVGYYTSDLNALGINDDRDTSKITLKEVTDTSYTVQYIMKYRSNSNDTILMDHKGNYYGSRRIRQELSGSNILKQLP